MSGVTTEQIQQLNNRVTDLNTNRHRMAGLRESAQAEFDRLRLAYKTKYGVELTPETLQEEYNKVYAEMQGKYLDTAEKVQSIENGDYKTANTTPSFNSTPNVEPVRAPKAVETPAQPAPQPVATPVANSANFADALKMQAKPVQPPAEMQQFLTPQPVEEQPTAPAVFSPAPEVQSMSDSSVNEKLGLLSTLETPTNEQPAPQQQTVHAPTNWGAVNTEKSLDDTFNEILK